MLITETFRSIQGEGKSQGLPCNFLRLAGCNLRCTWCDTPASREGGTDKSEEEVAAAIGRLPGRRLCITGGEPLLQKDELLPLVRRLHKLGYRMEIETNGTIDFRQLQPYTSICMDVKCPSSGEQSDLSLLGAVKSVDSVKFVVGDHKDLCYAADVMENHPIRGEIFFSPVHGSPYREAAEFLISRDLDARLQLQLHKLIGVR